MISPMFSPIFIHRNMTHLIRFSLSFFFFIVPCVFALLPTQHLCHHDQMYALLQFKDMFSLDRKASPWCNSYPKTMSWNNKSASKSDCCLWDGVTCDSETGHVIELDLSCSQLTGIISPNTSSGIFRLTYLRRLNLAHSNLYGSLFSPAFGRFAYLTHLNLSHTYFTGSVPGELSFLSKLVSLDLSNNYLTLGANDFGLLLKNLTYLEELILSGMAISSSIPNSVMNSSSLEIIDLSNSGLQGIFPGEFFMLPKLRELRLEGNNMTGDFPDISAVNTSSLQILTMGDNNFFGHGGLPDSVGNLTSLTVLDLSRTGLAGKLPYSIGNLENLTHLRLSRTKLRGGLPMSIGNLISLRVLDLSSTEMAGELPDSIGDLESLTYLRLSSCNFSGSIPLSLGNLTNIVELDLSRNDFHNQVPFTITNLNKLESLLLRYNRLTGPMPPNASGLQNLRLLWASNNMINGTLPSWLFTLPSLVELMLSYNQLTGPIPAFPHESSFVLIDLSNNHLDGHIPHSMVNLVNLSSLLLSSNKLSGTVEPFVFSMFEQLQALDLSHNFLQGEFPVPPKNLKWLFSSHNNFNGGVPLSICNLTSLQIVDVSFNDLGGEIPQCLVNNSHLQVLDLQKNRFHGTIPSMSATMLRTFNLNGNHLEGNLPESLAYSENLILIDFGRNGFIGSFPHWFESFSQLQVLVLHSNKFQGPIGTLRSKSPFPRLRIFDLSDNEFSGLLPASFFQNFIAMRNATDTEGGPTYMGRPVTSYQDSISIVWKGLEVEIEHILTTLVTIDLSINRFEGKIPDAIQDLKSLRMLNLSYNSLTGPIPASFGELSNLEILDITFNKLTGTIPIGLASMTSLAILNVSRNHLVGPIPRGKQFNTFENNSYVENSGLCGFPLSNLCGDDKKPPSPEVTDQEEDNSFFSSGFTWKIVLFGYGCGVPFGLILGYLMLFGRPRWFFGIAM